MRTATPRAIGLAIALAATLALPAIAGQSGPTAVKAFYRQGQTFITWKEDSAAKGEWYKVYASDKPISNVKAATLIAKIPEGSRSFRWAQGRPFSQFKTKVFQPFPKPLEVIQLEDDEGYAKQLPEGTGVFVRTVKKAGARYYAVTIEKGGSESAAVTAGVNSLKAPVKELVETPGAVLLAKPKGRKGYVYLFFTDFEVWNPDKIDDNHEGYAHVCYVSVLPKASGEKQLPLAVRLHAYGAYHDWMTSSAGPRERVHLGLLDYNLTWWYGYSDSKPKMGGSGYNRAPVKGTVRNFTERRVLQAVRWLLSKPANCKARVDPARVCIYGGSMGGSGVNVLGLRHGEVFAAGAASVGVTNWAVPKKILGWSLAQHVGPMKRNDPTDEGLGVYDLLNMPKWLGDHPEIETPFLDSSHGIIDRIISFYTVPDFYRGLARGKHPYVGTWDMIGHGGSPRTGAPMKWELVRHDEPLPALAGASSDTPLKSGFRIVGWCEKVEARTITIKAGALKRSCHSVNGNFPPDLAGKTLVIYPSAKTSKWWRVKSSTGTTVTIEDGDMVAYEPPIVSWDKGVWMRKHKPGTDLKALGPEDLAAIRAKHKKFFLICDGHPRGQRNGFFTWSSRNQNFDPASKADDIVDEAKRFAISMRMEKNIAFGEPPASATADVTPRRCKSFKPKPGAKVAWENISFADPRNPKKVAGGEATADKHGLVTVPKFQIGKKGWGNRLVLKTK